MSCFKTKLILLVRMRGKTFSRDVLYFYVEMLFTVTFQVFTLVMYWNLKANEQPTNLYDQITAFWAHGTFSSCILPFTLVNSVGYMSYLLCRYSG